MFDGQSSPKALLSAQADANKALAAVGLKLDWPKVMACGIKFLICFAKALSPTERDGVSEVPDAKDNG